MKRYIIKPEYIDNFGSEANAYTTITEHDIALWAKDFNTSEEQILDMLIEDDSDKKGYNVLYRFDGKKSDRTDFEKLNSWISLESGDPNPFFPTEEDFRQAIKEGFVTWDGYYTTIWIDE